MVSALQIALILSARAPKSVRVPDHPPSQQITDNCIRTRPVQSGGFAGVCIRKAWRLRAFARAPRGAPRRTTHARMHHPGGPVRVAGHPLPTTLNSGLHR